ncbi:MAG: spore coat U domain-containing protein [Sphingopyxis sp.]|uniref:Csu type fimbrial protein n=1 Tax=Sphingopyxis sp. TaxID=1908224 RepID=UPI002ABB088C|nr:spore coat U domain-containing protein [Sphingopyxis sp.]MDZ3831313.1 spore coat U domain-containing protein [Sphingopyxis sp.]
MPFPLQTRPASERPPAARPLGARLIAGLLAIGLTGPLAASLPARAETSAQFDVTASVVAGCLVDGLGDSGNAGLIGTLDFGVDSSLSTATHLASTNGSQSIRLRCTPGVDLMVGVDGGTHAAVGARNLQRGGDTASRIPYSLCSDAACIQPIAIGGTASVAVTGANSDDVRLPLFASLTLPGNLPPGTYTDTLTVTLAW